MNERLLLGTLPVIIKTYKQLITKAKIEWAYLKIKLKILL